MGEAAPESRATPPTDTIETRQGELEYALSGDGPATIVERALPRCG